MKEKFVSCGHCNNGYIYNHKTLATEKCKCLLEFQRKAKLVHLLKKANIPIQLSSDKRVVNILDYKIKQDYVGEDKNKNLFKIEKFINNFKDKYSSINLYFYGVQGTQKSTIMRVMGRELLKKGFTVHYTLADTLIKQLIDAERDEDLKRETERILKVDLLLIDELDESKITKYKSGYQIPFITTFLKKRLEVIRKSVVFSSNRKIDNMGEFFGEALQDLIYREVLDKTTIFEDNYEKTSSNFSVDDLWKD